MRRLNESLRITGRGLMDFTFPHSSLTSAAATWENSGSANMSTALRKKAPQNSEGPDVGT